MALWFRVSLAIWLVLIAALSLSLFLNYAKFDSTYAEMSRSRYRVLAQDISAAIEAGLALGLGIGELRNTQQIVERTRAEARELRGVTVADARGAILFDSERVREERFLPADQVAAIVARTGEDAWSAVDGRTAVLGLPILNAFQVPVGVVMLRYDAGHLAAARAKALRQMLWSMAAVTVAVTLATMLLRLPAGVWLVLLAGLGAGLYMHYGKFTAVAAEMAHSRFQVLAQDIRNSAEGGLALGLGIGELRNIQGLLDRTKAEADDIRSVAVADARGLVLFDTERGQTERSLPEAQVAAIAAQASVNGAWAAMKGEDALLGVPILNAFQVPVGVVLLRYDASMLETVTAKALDEMLRSLLVIVAGITLVTVPLVMWSFSSVRRTFREMHAAAESLLPAEVLTAQLHFTEPAEAVKDAAAESGPPLTADSLEAEFGAFASNAANTLERLRMAQCG